MLTPILMRRELSGALPVPEWREGVHLARFQDVDPVALHALMQAAYADGKVDAGLPASPADWWTATRTDAEFDPTLSFVAKAATGELAGFALVWNSSFIKDLVVAPGWQRRGIGAALLAEIFRALAARGFDRVELKVQPDNLRAKLLYRALGFVEAR